MCDILALIGIKPCNQLSYFWFDAHHRHRKANDSGRTDRNLSLTQPKLFGNQFAGLAGIADAFNAGAGIGIATIGDNGLHLVGF